MDADEIERFFRRVEQGVEVARQEREDPTRLLERAEAHLRELVAELEAREASGWGATWRDSSAMHYLHAARRELDAGRPLAAAAEMFFLGQALVQLEAPLIDLRKQGARRRGTEARWKESVRGIVARLGTRNQERVLEAIRNAIDLTESDGFEFVSVDDEAIVYMLSNGKRKTLSLATLADFLRRPERNRLR